MYPWLALKPLRSRRVSTADNWATANDARSRPGLWHFPYKLEARSVHTYILADLGLFYYFFYFARSGAVNYLRCWIINVLIINLSPSARYGSISWTLTMWLSRIATRLKEVQNVLSYTQCSIWYICWKWDQQKLCQVSPPGKKCAVTSPFILADSICKLCVCPNSAIANLRVCTAFDCWKGINGDFYKIHFLSNIDFY